MTLPGPAPRPHRPATWLTSWKVRSVALKSGRLIAVSALITPTSCTPGKSSPLAIICVPSISRISPAPNRCRAW
jgi:hypothetical protein